MVVPRSRAELALSESVVPLGGGTWLFSERQDHLTGLVDLMGLAWKPWEWRPDGALSVAGTCTVAELVGIPGTGPLFRQSAESLLQSFKIWSTATIGGNLATALPAGALIGLGAALDADLVVWTPDGGARREQVARFVLGPRATTLRTGEVIRSVEIEAGPLKAVTAFRRIALSPLGRAGTVVMGRRDEDGTTVFSVTGGTSRPEVVRFENPPTPRALRDAVGTIDSWFSDAHGAADWRRAMTHLLAEQVRGELS